MLEKTVESPFDCKEIKLVSPKGNQSWIFIGRTDAEGEAPILWSPDAESQLIGKDPDTGKDWRQEQKGTTEDEMVGWHHRLNGHEFEQAPGDGEGQGSLACCSPWGHKESDMTEWLNSNQDSSKALSVRDCRLSPWPGGPQSHQPKCLLLITIFNFNFQLSYNEQIWHWWYKIFGKTLKGKKIYFNSNRQNGKIQLPGSPLFFFHTLVL